jgi:Arc/MetJ-type ribon-helix-helix transcriptional regulator
MSVQIPLRIPEQDLRRLDEAIARGRFTNRSSALRAALELLLRTEREREIDDAYRTGYSAHPQEEWVGDAGLAAFAAFVAAEEKDAKPL